MKSVKLLGCVAALLVCAVNLTVLARLVCYEGCDYGATNNVNGLNGGSGWQAGWAWAGTATRFWQVAEAGLSYADGTTNLATKGGTFRGSYNGWDQCTRKPSAVEFPQLQSNNFFGKVGTTNWFAFLVRFQGGSPTSGNFGFTLRQPDHFGEKVWLGMRYGITNTYTAGGWGAPYDTYPNAPLAQDQTVFLVTRFIYGDYAFGYQRISLWGNPSLAGEPSDSTAVTNYWSMNYDASGIKSRMWDQISLVANAGTLATGLWYCIDELRVGETFRDVAPRDFDLSPVARPSNVSPANGALDQALPVLLQASAFSSVPGDVHEKTKITLRSGSGVITVINTGALTQVALGAGVLRSATKYAWSVQYKGTNSPVYSDASAETTFTTAADGTPNLIAYDGCPYAPTPFPGDVHGYDGGAGWLSPWQGGFTIAGYMRVASETPGLYYQFTSPAEWLLSANNRFRTDERGKNYEAGTEERILQFSRENRQVGTDGGMNLLTPSNTYGKTGTTNWFSFLARYEEGDTSARFGMELYNQSVSVVGDTPFFFLIGKPAGQSMWGMVANNGSASAVSSVDATDGNTAFLVCRIIYGDPTETAHLWVNPTSRTEPLEANATVFNNVPNFEFNYIGIQANSASQAPRYGADELRFGNAWEAVMPSGPAPPLSVGTPVNVAPANGALDLPLPLTISASAFSGAGPGDLHIATEVQFTSLDGANLTVSTGGMSSLQVPAGLLKNATQYAWIVRYLGTNNPAWSEWSAPTSFTTAQGPPALLSYDGAAYLATTNVVPNRAGGFGWRGAWAAAVWNTLPPGTYYYAMVNVGAPGLTYADLITTSNRFVTSPYGWTYGAWGNTDMMPFSSVRRTLGRDGAMHLLNANNTFGKPGTTNWFSFLARAEDSTGTIYGIDLAMTNTVNDGGLLAIGRVPDTNAWGLWYPATSLSAASDVSAEAGTALLVVRLAAGAAGDTAHLWVNPLLGSEPAETNATVLADFPHIEYQCVDLMSVGAPAPFIGIDEVRMGDSWQSVTPVIPEPHTLALLALLACAARMRRQR